MLKGTGIEVTNTPGVLTDATAEIAMMLILMSARRAGEGKTSPCWRMEWLASNTHVV